MPETKKIKSPRLELGIICTNCDEEIKMIRLAERRNVGEVVVCEYCDETFQVPDVLVKSQVIDE